MQTLTNLTDKLISAFTMHEKGKFFTQPESSPKSQQNPQLGNSGNQNMSQVKWIISLRGGKVIEKHILDPHEISKESISDSKKEFVKPLTHKEVTNFPHFLKY